MLNFVICDDNKNILEKLAKMIESILLKHNFDGEVVCSSTSANEILDFVNANKSDVLILDIDLKSNISGLELAKKVREYNKNCYIIFFTGHLEYAMLAYKLKTFDYLPKPLTYERLEETIIRLYDDITGLPRRFIKIDNKNTMIDENEINYIRREGMKLVFNTDSKDYEIYSSFNKIQDILPDNFVRCHKSFVANINKIVNVEPVSNMLFFENNSCCDIGPKFKNNLMEVLKNNGNIE